jgi:dolichyl-phosphate beta-glucosyltransferase
MRAKSEAGDILLSVVIPSFNEESEIGNFLGDVRSYLEQQNFNAEIIVVDDASTDSTYEVLNQFRESYPIRILRNNVNAGKGHSVKEGVMASRGKFVVVMDADSAYAISSVYDFLSPLVEAEYDIAVGNRRIYSSRFVLSPKHLPYVYVRHLLSQIFNVFTRMIVLPKYTDTQCGYKCFSRKAAIELFALQRIKGFCFDVEVLFLAEKQGYRCVEVPVTFYYDGEASTVKLFPLALYFLLDLIRIRFNDILGRYDVGKKE